MAIDEDERLLDRTSTILPCDATNPLWWARRKYEPGDNVRSSNRPAPSVTAKAAVAPSADTTAPLMGTPLSSWTTP
jgi:hypothetical protein